MSNLLKNESLLTGVSGGNKMPRRESLVVQVLGQRTVLAALAGVASWVPLIVMEFNPAWRAEIPGVWQAGFIVVPLVLFLATLWFAWLDYVRPWSYLRGWLLAIHGGDLSARMPLLKNSAAFQLCDDLNSLSDMLESQSNHAERQLREHTDHIAEKSRLLSALYRIVSSLNTASFDDMFGQVLKTINEELNIDTIILRERLQNGRMHKLAGIGKAPAAQDQEELAEDSPYLQTAADEGRLVVPLQYRQRTVGACSFYLEPERLKQPQALEELLTSIGRHLGNAIEKAHLDEENIRLSIVEERAWLANELHDSLAQTVSSLRFQVRVLDQSVHEGDEATVWQHLETVENTLEQANHEVRNLIEYFKGYSTKRPEFSAVDQLVIQFRRDNPDIKVVLDNTHWVRQGLPPEYTLQVSRIIQEALTNARNHGEATFIRILLRSDGGEHFVLIEDNGVGISDKGLSSDSEKHFGMSVMRERAESIGGHLEVDSERDEGVRVTLKFHYSPPVN